MEHLLKKHIIKNIRPQIFNLKKYSSISIKKLASGCYNINYLVKINSKKFVFRVSVYSDGFEGDNLNKEHELLKKLNGLHSPKVFYYDKKFKYPLLVEEFVEGKRISKLSNFSIKKIAESLAEIHISLKPDKKMRSYSIKKIYLSRFKKRLELIRKNPRMYKILSKYVDKGLNYLEKKDRIFQKYKTSLLSHGDMQCGNILLKGKDIVFIDWENSKFDDPSFDIVAFFYESENLQYFNEKDSISKANKDLFVKEYMKTNPDSHLIDKIKILYPLRWLSDTLWLACRIIDYENIPLGLREKSKEEYLSLYHFNLKRLQNLLHQNLNFLILSPAVLHCSKEGTMANLT